MKGPILDFWNIFSLILAYFEDLFHIVGDRFVLVYNGEAQYNDSGGIACALRTRIIRFRRRIQYLVWK